MTELIHHENTLTELILLRNSQLNRKKYAQFENTLWSKYAQSLFKRSVWLISIGIAWAYLNTLYSDQENTLTSEGLGILGMKLISIVLIIILKKGRPNGRLLLLL